MIKVLFVCLGNICRSPSADAMLRKKVAELGLQERVVVDSSGTANWHVGKQPDERSIQHGAKRGYDLTVLRARQACSDDFNEFDYVLAMDADNLKNLQAIMPASPRTQPQLFLKAFGTSTEHEVPDPFYGGEAGFEHVLDLLEQACDALLVDIQQRLSLS